MAELQQQQHGSEEKEVPMEGGLVEVKGKTKKRKSRIRKKKSDGFVEVKRKTRKRKLGEINPKKKGTNNETESDTVTSEITSKEAMDTLENGSNSKENMDTSDTISDSRENSNEMDTLESAPKRPRLPPISAENISKGIKSEMRKIPVPSNRYAPLKENWTKIFTPVVEHLHLQIRFNLKSRNVEIRTCKDTTDIGALQKGADFVRAFTYGFEVEDAMALIRLDDLFLESFEVTDVKPLKGDHVARAVGRLAGKNGQTKYTVENVTKTRIVLAHSKIHIMGSFQNIAMARRSICNLILGSPPSKVYGNMRAIASRSAERF